MLRGYSGYNTRWALFLLDKIFPKSSEAPGLVTVFFGANDAALPDADCQRQHVPVAEFKANLHHIISHIKGLSETTLVVLIAPRPIDEVGYRTYARETYGVKAEDPPGRTNEVTGQYAKACKEVSGEACVPVIDLWSIFQQRPNWQTYLSAGLHLTPEGNSVVLEELVKLLGGSPYCLSADTMDCDFPEVDAQNHTFQQSKADAIKLPT